MTTPDPLFATPSRGGAHAIQGETPSIAVASFPTGAKTELRVTVDVFEGRKRLNARTWYARRDGSWAPTVRGVVVPIEHLAAFAASIAKAVGLAGIEP